MTNPKPLGSVGNLPVGNRRPRPAGTVTALADALLAAALKAADDASDGSVIAAKVRLRFDEMRKRDPRIADPADTDIAALLRGEPPR
jgi:hypothetical protein